MKHNENYTCQETMYCYFNIIMLYDLWLQMITELELVSGNNIALCSNFLTFFFSFTLELGISGMLWGFSRGAIQTYF